MVYRVLGVLAVAVAAIVAVAQPPVEQNAPGSRPAAKMIVSFDGLGAAGRNPSDNSLAVGPNHIVQIVNSSMTVFDKTGKVLYGAAPANSIFKGFGGVCEARNNLDAVVRYDQLAGRWLYVVPIFTRIAERPDEPYSMCYAVSTGADPMGPYYRYEFRRKLLPAYPRPAVWPDGYYASNCVADRAKMLTGAAATEQCVILDNVNFLNNSDIHGKGLPPAGAPNIMMAAGGKDDGIYVRTFHVDWRNPKNTKVSDLVKIPVAPYQGDKIMQRLVYRNIGGRESIVALHSVNGSTGGDGLRWYEFRLDEKRDVRLFQQGTYASDGLLPRTASPAMDRQGDIAIGYSFRTNNSAGERFAARLPDDPPGTFSLRETVLVESQALETTANAAAAAMDPSDDCTFWYAGGYLKKDAAAYSTRIGAFRLPGCLRGTVSGAAYLDLNHNGKREEGEPGIKGREIAYSGAESGKAVTDADGAYRISLPADPVYADPVYTVAGKTIHLKDGDAVTMDFPEVCTVKSAGAMNAKFWMAGKGQDAVDNHYGEFRKLVNTTLYLVNADGTRLIVKRYLQFQTWLHKPPSAFMGSLALAGLNAECGTLDGNATVLDPIANDWISIHTLLKRASDAAAAKRPTEAYKALLDRLNSNAATITPSNPAKCGGG